MILTNGESVYIGAYENVADIPDGTCAYLNTYVVPTDFAVQEVINYAMWAKGGKQFVESRGRLPESWEEFRSWFTSTFDGVRILDVGCGSGYFGARLAEKGAKVVGIDPALDPSNPRRPKKVYSHPNLTLVPAMLEGFKCVSWGLDESIAASQGVLRTILSSVESLKQRIGSDFDLVLCMWMKNGLNLSPAIRAFGVNGIFYTISPHGGTGVDFGECGSLGYGPSVGLPPITDPDCLDLIMSFRRGKEYKNYRDYRYAAVNASNGICPTVGRIQFRNDVPEPDFEMTRRRAEEQGELCRVETFVDVEIFTQGNTPALPYDVASLPEEHDTKRRRWYQLFDVHRDYSSMPDTYWGRRCPEDPRLFEFNMEDFESLDRPTKTELTMRCLDLAETQRVTRIIDARAEQDRLRRQEKERGRASSKSKRRSRLAH